MQSQANPRICELGQLNKQYQWMLRKELWSNINTSKLYSTDNDTQNTDRTLFPSLPKNNG